MKKIYFISLIAIIAMLAGAGFVSAKECSNIVSAPHMYEVSPAVRDRNGVFNLHTAEETCIGNNTEVWFSGIKTLPDSWTHATGNLWMDLYEEDVNNADDRVKEYVGFIEGKVITEIRKHRTYLANVAIDSEGDNRAELYLTFYSSGTLGRSIEKSLFYYKICMN